jgi:hypothetical protein
MTISEFKEIIGKSDSATIYRAIHKLYPNLIVNRKTNLTNEQADLVASYIAKDHRMIDITGKKYGKLTAVQFDHTERTANGKQYHYWLFRCDCGMDIVLRKNNVTSPSQHVKSCGCLVAERTKEVNTRHGDTGKPIFNTWAHMMERAGYECGKNIKDYGGRGITVCKEWRKYENFREWAVANGYKDGLSIDRIDFNGNYEPTNCRWVTINEQQNNKRTNVFIEYEGKKMTATQWAIYLGIKPCVLLSRLRLGWDTAKALTTPIDKRRNISESKAVDITGNKYGSLTALHRDSERKAKYRAHYWIFCCDCGRKVSILKQNVTKGHTQSCGCSRKKH